MITILADYTRAANSNIAGMMHICSSNNDIYSKYMFHIEYTLWTIFKSTHVFTSSYLYILENVSKTNISPYFKARMFILALTYIFRKRLRKRL